MKAGKIAFFAVAALLAVLSAASQIALRRASPVAAPAAAEGLLAALGGLRSIVSEAIWMRADRLQREGQFVELAQLASTLTKLEPHEPEVWSFAAWNLAYNICAMMPSDEDRWRWVLAGIRLLRDDGIRLNPEAGELYRELAWHFELKFIKNVDHAYMLYREKWRELVEDVSRRGAWSELGMTREKMDEIEKRYGVGEWTSPFASAIYWAHFGLPYATPQDAAFMREIIRQCVVIHERDYATRK